MKQSRILLLIKIFAGLYVTFLLVSCTSGSTAMNDKIPFKDNWQVQQSGRLAGATGTEISTGKVSDSIKWYHASVPSTIMSILIGNGLYDNVFMADSIKNIDRGQFEQSWWYRTEFSVPETGEDRHVRLCFDGISYYANIWLNGTQVASKDDVYGTFRTFEFDVTHLIKNSRNVLAVEVFKQKPGDFGHGFVDWNPRPPDDNMGIWREAYLKITGDVALKNTFISSDVNTETLDEASLTITTDIVNYSDKAIKGKLTGAGDGIRFNIPVTLEAGETKRVTITPDEAESLHISHPRLWWCNGLGDPSLYNINVSFRTGRGVSDSEDITFGIRKIETYFNESGHRGFRLNGKEVLIRGAGWTDEIFLGDTEEKNEIQVQYVKHMNLNTIRFENIWGTSQNIYDLCDRYGILAMVGWSCQWEWENYLGKECDEFGGIKTQADMDLAIEYMGDQIRYLQNHPSIFVWLLGSDMLPRPVLEERYRDLITGIDDRPYLPAASRRKSEVSGPTGVKMLGPYNYVGPSYWYVDSVNGGAYGFNTETGPGPQIPVLETLEKMIPPNKLWPINDIWNFHCNPSESFGDLSIFNNVLFRRYGAPNNLENYLLKANVQGYEAMKGMFEAFRANKPNSTGIIQWMLNSAWPSFYWQLYDFYLLPTSAYYAAKKANEPVQLVYNYENNKIYAVNETFTGLEKARARVRLFDLQGHEISSEETIVDIRENRSAPVYDLPKFPEVVFLSLTLLDNSNKVVADNFYWLASKQDEYDWEKTEWYYTPVKTSADFKGLNYMASSEVEITTNTKEHLLEVTLKNNPDRVAFFIDLALKNSSGQTLYPVFWNDNYISLLPGETKTLRCRVPDTLDVTGGTTLHVEGWNVRGQQIDVAL